jgi:hypothetical protein
MMMAGQYLVSMDAVREAYKTRRAPFSFKTTTSKSKTSSSIRIEQSGGIREVAGRLNTLQYYGISGGLAMLQSDIDYRSELISALEELRDMAADPNFGSPTQFTRMIGRFVFRYGSDDSGVMRSIDPESILETLTISDEESAYLVTQELDEMIERAEAAYDRVADIMTRFQSRYSGWSNAGTPSVYYNDRGDISSTLDQKESSVFGNILDLIA